MNSGSRKNFRLNTITSFLFAVCCIAVAGCSSDPPAPANPGFSGLAARSNRVVAVAYPLAYLSERLLEETGVSVEFPDAGSDSPGNWQPPADAVTEMQSADLVITNGPGVPYAQWLTRVTLARKKTCVSAADLPTADFITVNDHKIVHRHGPEGEHSHPYMVPYSWLDPAVALRQARKIATDLIATYPDHQESIERNLESLAEDLDSLSAKLDATKPGEQVSVMSANPNLKFLTRAAGLNDVHLLWLDEIPEEPLEEVHAKVLAATGAGQPDLRWLEAGRPRVMLWPSSLGPVPEIEGWLPVEIDLLDRRPSTGDYLSVMDDNIEQLVSRLN